MTLKQFMEENQVIAFQVVPDVVILNAVVDQTDYALDVDTSNIPFGTQLQTENQFSVVDDVLTVGTLSLNTAQTYMLGMDDGNL